VFADGFRALWEQRFDRLETYLQTLQSTSKKETRHARRTRRK